MNFVLHGYPVSGGITLGYAHLVSTARLEVAHYEVAEEAVDAEVARFDRAMTAAQDELRLKDRLHPPLSQDLEMPDEFEQTQLPLFLPPEVVTHLWTARIIEQDEEQATREIA